MPQPGNGIGGKGMGETESVIVLNYKGRFGELQIDPVLMVVVRIGQRLTRLLDFLAKVASGTLAVGAVLLDEVGVAPARARRLTAGDRA